MPQKIEFEGQQFEFPDDATPEEISGLLEQASGGQGIPIEGDIMQRLAPQNRPPSAVASIIEQGGGPEDRLEALGTTFSQGVKDVGGGVLQRGAELLATPQAGGLAIDQPEADIETLTQKNELQQAAATQAAAIEAQVSSVDPNVQLAEAKFPVTSFIGRGLGQTAAFPLSPAKAKTLYEATLAGVKMGTAFGFVQPTNAEQSAVSNAVWGGILGGGFGAFSDQFMVMARKGINAAGGKINDLQIKKLIDEAVKRNIPIYTSDLTNNPFLSFMTKASNEIPLIGMSRNRVSQSNAGKEAVLKFKNRMENMDPDLEGVIQHEFTQKIASRKAHRDQLWNRVSQATDGGGEVPLQAMRVTAQKEMLEEMARGAQANPEVIKTLQKMLQTQPGNFSFHSESTRPFIGEKINTFFTGDSTLLGAKGVGRLQRVKLAIDSDMEKFAMKQGRQAQQLYKRANVFTGKLNDDLRKTGLKRLVNSREPEKIMGWLSAGKGFPSRNRTAYKNLTEDGRAGVRSAIIRDAWQEGFDESTGIFDSRAFVKSVRNRQGVVDIFFKDREHDELQGLVNVLAATKQAADVATGSGSAINVLARRLTTVPVALAAGAAGGAVGGVAGGAGAVGIPVVLLRMMESKLGRNLLFAAGRETPGTAGFDAIIPKLMTQINKMNVADISRADQEKRVRDEDIKARIQRDL